MPNAQPSTNRQSGPAQDGPAWSDADLTSDPHDRADKAERVRTMFGSIARRYDLNNRVHSLWRDQAWRRYAVRAAAPGPASEVLDCACGTGDLTEAFARHPGVARVVGSDFTPQMLDLAGEKRRRLPDQTAEKIAYVGADAMALPFESRAFDLVSIAFGIRNVQDPRVAIGEFYRVLRPGGRLVILEFDRPRFAPVRWFNTVYSSWIMPHTATLISGDRSGAYKYLPRSVSSFMTASALGELATEAGFVSPRSRALTFGICACTVADRTAR